MTTDVQNDRRNDAGNDAGKGAGNAVRHDVPNDGRGMDDGPRRFPAGRAAPRPRMALLAGAASLATVMILIFLKSLAYLESGAASVLSSLIDSVIDAGISLMTFLAIHISLKPADSEHRYGHGKVEGLAALFQAAMIAGAGLFLLLESIKRFVDPHPVTHHSMVIVVMGISIVLSCVLVAIQKYSLRHAPSLAVEADSAHYSMDIVVNLGVIAVMGALHLGAPALIDPLFAIGVSLYLGMIVRDIAGKGVDMLLDRELPGDARETITRKVLSHRQILGMHDLRTNKSGMWTFISFDIEVERSLSLYDAHEIAREVEHTLLLDFPMADIMIHVDPHGDTDDTRHKVAGVHD